MRNRRKLCEQKTTPKKERKIEKKIIELFDFRLGRSDGGVLFSQNHPIQRDLIERLLKTDVYISNFDVNSSLLYTLYECMFKSIVRNQRKMNERTKESRQKEEEKNRIVN